MSSAARTPWSTVLASPSQSTATGMRSAASAMPLQARNARVNAVMRTLFDLFHGALEELVERPDVTGPQALETDPDPFDRALFHLDPANLTVDNRDGGVGRNRKLRRQADPEGQAAIAVDKDTAQGDV